MELFTKESLEALFAGFGRMRALVIGDVMVDAYLWGRVERISPEAPVPVVAVSRRSSHLGGAANVALNLQALGADTVLCSVVGRDVRGDELLELMRERKLDTTGILQSTQRITTTKFRIFGNRTQMLRVDEETTEMLSPEDSATFDTMLRHKIESEPWDVIVFQDYDKGLIYPALIEGVCDLARQRGIPVAVDPKRRHFRMYKGVSLFKPNLKELGEGMNLPFATAADSGFREAVNSLHRGQDIDTVLVTLSHEGVFVSQRGTGQQVPAYIRNVADVSGAGDTVISVAALGLARGLTPTQVAALGNLAGGLVCEEVGVVPLNLDKLKQEALKKLC
jgi:D-glycero-beta-D-manno-heptose-7-phosphate kinase